MILYLYSTLVLAFNRKLLSKYFHIKNPEPEFYKDSLIKAAPQLHQDVYNSLSSRLLPGSKVLDIGSGEAAFARRLADQGFIVTTLDSDFYEKHSSLERHISLDLDNPAETSQFSLSNTEQFDCVLCLEVLEHLKNPFCALQISKDVLKTGGILCISTPNISNWYSRLLFLKTGEFHQFLTRDLEWGHITPLSSSQLLGYLSMLKLRVSYFGSVGRFPIFNLSSLSQLSTSILAALIRPFQFGQLMGSSIFLIATKDSSSLSS